MSIFSDDESGCVSFMGYLIKNTSSLLHPDLRALEAYWQDLRAGRACPYRAEVDPRDIPSKIGHLFILEDLGCGNIRFRISGTALTDAFGMELRGMPVGSIMEFAARQSLTELLRETLAEPGVGQARLSRSEGRAEAWEIVLLPLRSDNGRIDRLIGALHCLEDQASLAGQPPLRFAIESMTITPVEITAEARETTAIGASGFGDGFATFSHGTPSRPPARAGLIAIAGGRAGGGGPIEGSAEAGLPGTRRPRPILRLVTDN